MAEYIQFNLPTNILFGEGSISKLPELCKKVNGTSALLVTGKSFVISSGLADRVAKDLNQAGIRCILYSQVPSEPDSELVDTAFEFFEKSKCDFIIGIGGGSVLDVAKYISIMARNGGKCTDYETGRAISLPGIPVIAIPTTAGTGSEVTPYSVINNSITKRKFTIGNPLLYPRHVIVDPDLTKSLPRDVTIAAGLDAFIHALEGFLNHDNPLLNPLAVQAMDIIFKDLPKASLETADHDVRRNMSLAALMGGIVISHMRTGMIHTMSVALSPHTHMPHGLLNAVITPYVLEFNSDFYGRKLKSVSELSVSKEILSDKEAVLSIRNWMKNLDVPAGLSSFNLDESIIPSLVNRVKQDAGLPGVNPRKFADNNLADIFKEILRS